MGSGIAAIAVVLAGAGIFALLSFTVRRRSREIGIRVAVGASRWDVVSLVLRQASMLGILGCGAGFGVAVLVGVVMRSALYGVSPVAPTVILPTVALLFLTAVLASVQPAWYALRVDPTVVLHDE